MSIFVSYCHKDERLFNELLSVLRSLERAFELAVWSDLRIRPGRPFQRDIKVAISRARISVLLVTQNYLDSDFVSRIELPRVLNKRGMSVVWIAGSASMYLETPLANMQAANDPETPLDTLRAPKRKQALVDIGRKIASLVETK